MMLPVSTSDTRTGPEAREGAIPLWTPDVAGPVDPKPFRAAVLALAKRAEAAAKGEPCRDAPKNGKSSKTESSKTAPAPEDAYAAQRALAAAHKTLLDVEARNAALRARSEGDVFTRLDSMAPFHPDDIARIEREAARLRAVVLAEGRLIGWREAMAELGGDADASPTAKP